MIDSFLKKQAYFTGIHPKVFLRSLRRLPIYVQHWRAYRKRMCCRLFR